MPVKHRVVMSAPIFQNEQSARKIAGRSSSRGSPSNGYGLQYSFRSYEVGSVTQAGSGPFGCSRKKVGFRRPKLVTLVSSAFLSSPSAAKISRSPHQLEQGPDGCLLCIEQSPIFHPVPSPVNESHVGSHLHGAGHEREPNLVFT